jgi:DNA topoisomerase I
MAKNYLVIVESPTKAKTIRKFLPKNFIVEASMGHVRDLPQTAADIPTKYKKEEWAKIGVNVEEDFQPLYVVPKGKSKIITELKKKLKAVDELYLATDEDREGESISYHLIEVLKPKVPIKRMVFHEITKTAIQRALEDVRDVDDRLVRAQETRRILDRLVGYTLSPLIWKKIAYGLSAGRVQSAGLRVIVERERERLAFQKAEYWDLSADLAKDKESFKAKLVSVAGQRVASGKDFDETTGKLLAGKSVLLLKEDDAKSLRNRLEKAPWTVRSVEEKQVTNRPAPPFITSTLQQEANRKLGLSARDAMRTAQKLYEEGLITYMRTDSPNLSKEAISGARSSVQDLYGKEYLSPEPRQYSSKTKGAQEAHEAIRPAGAQFLHPSKTGLSGVQLSLYDLIWKRTVATQMAEAKKLSMTVRITADDAEFTSSGMRILFPGFLRAYVEGSDDPEEALGDKEVTLPALSQGDQVNLDALQALYHETKPPARFTEASLVKILEKEGVGRPSTYASIIDTIVNRGYVRKVGNALVPTFTGFAVIQLLEKNFSNLVDMNFTSQMEEYLDGIAEGKKEWLPYLKEFYLGKNGLLEQVKRKDQDIDANETRAVEFGHLNGLNIRIGRFGPYVVRKKEGQDGKMIEVHASIPEEIAPADLTADDVEDLLERMERGPEPLGVDPKTGEKIYVLIGRYGPYFQLGEVTEEVPKPKRASLPKGMKPDDANLEIAGELLSLPRTLGEHPETGKPVTTNLGRFGPYVAHDGDFRSLKKDDNVFTVHLARALEILAEEKRSRGGSKVLKELGKHPDTEKVIVVCEGRYGPYLKHGTKNASLPKDMDPERVTLEQAVELLGGQDKKGGKKATKKAVKKTSKARGKAKATKKAVQKKTKS